MTHRRWLAWVLTLGLAACSSDPVVGGGTDAASDLTMDMQPDTQPDLPEDPASDPQDLAPACPMGQTLCGTTCTDTQSDTSHCGTCGTTCMAGQSCVAGRCECRTGTMACGGSCIDLQSDTNHCGMCGNACPRGRSCVAGVCSCLMGRVECAGTCIDVQSDERHCGRCDNVCPAGQSCVMGVCVCPMGQTLCGGACVDTATNTANCGRCGNACPAGQTCAAGACVCPTGQTACGTGASLTCVDFQSDRAHCGACGRACAEGQMCTMGTCVCPTGQTLCGSGATAACVDTATSNAHCGGCGNACGSAQTCRAGVCTCPSGQTACGTACVDLQSSNLHCGACNRFCFVTQSCVAGTCACPTGQTACEVTGLVRCFDLQTDHFNCGACGRVCGVSQSCVDGLCGVVPSNDTRDRAIAIPLTTAQSTFSADTTGASNHTMGPSGCSCTRGRDVFYSFTLTQEEVVYADTFDGESWDSSLFLQDEMGNNLTPGAGDVTCNDDACGTRRSQLSARLPPGRYYLVVSGCSQGVVTVRFQHLAVGSAGATRIPSPAMGTQAVSGTIAPGAGRVNGGCGSDGPEHLYFFTVCPNFTGQTLHVTTCGGASWDTVLHQHSPSRTPVSVCNDDFCGLQSSLEATLPAGAGLHGWYLDTFGSRTPGTFTLRYTFGACSTGFTACGSPAVCRYTQEDTSHCGACGRVCTGGQVCAMGSCVCPPGQTLCGLGASALCANLQTSSAHCGVCGNACLNGSSCLEGSCRYTASTRDVTVSGTQTINTVAASVHGTAGSNRVTVTNVVGGSFAVGDLLLLHQTQHSSGAAGFSEIHRVAAVMAGAPTILVLEGVLNNTYVTSDAPFARAQTVRVEELRNLTVPAGATLTAPAWNGNSGGILAVVAGGVVTVAGTITMDGRGFRGRGHPCTYRCGRGFQGEGIRGLGGADIAANGNGGGGGGAGQDDGSGGGGGHAAAGGNGGNGTCGVCREACPVPGGTGGSSVGTSNLGTAFFLGGAGGEGGADEDGSNPGVGGNGGGVVFLRASSFNVTGLIAARGAAGSNGSNACGGVGCGMGGGGGGAGGAIRLQASGTAAVGTNLLHVNGAAGGGATCGTAVGGAGSVGRIGINAVTVTGTTTPAFDRN